MGTARKAVLGSDAVSVTHPATLKHPITEMPRSENF